MAFWVDCKMLREVIHSDMLKPETGSGTKAVGVFRLLPVSYFGFTMDTRMFFG